MHFCSYKFNLRGKSMDNQLDTLNKILAELTQLRTQEPKPRKYPQALWKAILSAVSMHSVREVSQRLNISYSYLKKKLNKPEQLATADFKEICLSRAPLGEVVIELFSKSDLRAKIQGPASCLSYLKLLLEE
jgi:hypothetical protein